MRLCLLRHGPAVPRKAGAPDEGRPLTAEGRERTRLAARGIRRLDLGIDAVWTSPLPRARETAEILASECGLPEPEVTDLLRPGVAPGRMLEILRASGGECPLFVGHEPDLGATVACLTGGRTGAFPMKKAGLAVLDLSRQGARPAGALLLFVAPSALRELGRI